MHRDSWDSRRVFTGGEREASRLAKGCFMPFRRRPGGSNGPPRGRRRRTRSSLRTFAAAFLIACSLFLNGCGGGGGSAAMREGGGPAPTPPPATTPPPSTTPPPATTPDPTPTPDPAPPTFQPPASQPPAPASTPPDTAAPPPPDAAKFNIRSGDDIDTVESLLESIGADDGLKPYLGGHVLSYVRYPRTEVSRTPIRERHGLPATGSDYMDASGLAAVFAGETFGKRFHRNSGRGTGAGWSLAPDVLTYSNWVDGIFFGTSIVGSTRTIAPFVLGVPSGVNPAGTEGTAVWTGTVAGRETGPVIGHLDGRATLTYDFEAANLDVVLDRLRYYESGFLLQDVNDITWEDLPVSSGSFGDCSGSGNCIRGRFFDDNDGNAAESVGGVFRRGFLHGAFGAQR